MCFSSCSQTRSTRQPSSRSSRVTRRSRALLLANFSNQNSRRVAGNVACSGQPCQKQPSTNMASLSLGKAKSGVPGKGKCLRHPLMPNFLNNRARVVSVDLFPRPLTRAMICDLVRGIDAHTARRRLVVTRADRWRSSMLGTWPPRSSTPNSIFRSMAASLKLALVTNARTPSATAHLA